MSRMELQVREADVENVHLRSLEPLISPEEVAAEFPASSANIETVEAGRLAVRNILHFVETPPRLVVITGPCSVHDPDAALEYADWLSGQREAYGDTLELLMRVYFEKPRTTVGWKGLINDPHLNETYDVNHGLLTARKLIRDITGKGVPVATELLDTITPHYFAGLVSWGAIGARTTESQLHRELASGLSFPVGFKNGTSGDIKVAVDAVEAAGFPHHFTATTSEGHVAIAKTEGNPDCHVVLRGGNGSPNYDEESVLATQALLSKRQLNSRVMIDFSHANSGKDYKKQIEVARDVSRQIAMGSTGIMGVMIESNLVAGAQPFVPGGPFEYGLSITDGCEGLEGTAEMFSILNSGMKQSR